MEREQEELGELSWEQIQTAKQSAKEIWEKNPDSFYSEKYYNRCIRFLDRLELYITKSGVVRIVAE